MPGITMPTVSSKRLWPQQNLQPFGSPKGFLQPIRRDPMAWQHSHTRAENPWLGISQLWIQYVQHTAEHQPKNLAKRLNRQNLEKSTNTVTSLISTSYLLELSGSSTRMTSTKYLSAWYMPVFRLNQAVRSHCLCLVLNTQETSHSYGHWFQTLKSKWKLNYERENEIPGALSELPDNWLGQFSPKGWLGLAS